MYAVLSATNNSAAQASNVAINWPVSSTSYPQSGYSRVQRSALREPITKGTNGNDNFSLNSKTKGLYWGGAGDDTFDYGDDPGKLNTRIAGGLGSDTFALSKLTAAQVLDALKSNNYTFIMRSNGFVLRTADGQEIQVANVEKIAFSDKTFDLTNPADMKALVDALKSKNITILDERNKPALTRYNSEVASNNRNQGQQSTQPNPANLIPLNSSNYPQSPNGLGNSQALNTTPEQAYFIGLGYAMYQNMMSQGNGLASAYNPNSYSNTYGASPAASNAAFLDATQTRELKECLGWLQALKKNILQNNGGAPITTAQASQILSSVQSNNQQYVYPNNDKDYERYITGLDPRNTGMISLQTIQDEEARAAVALYGAPQTANSNYYNNNWNSYNYSVPSVGFTG